MIVVCARIVSLLVAGALVLLVLYLLQLFDEEILGGLFNRVVGLNLGGALYELIHHLQDYVVIKVQLFSHGLLAQELNLFEAKVDELHPVYLLAGCPVQYVVFQLIQLRLRQDFENLILHILLDQYRFHQRRRVLMLMRVLDGTLVVVLVSVAV